MVKTLVILSEKGMVINPLIELIYHIHFWDSHCGMDDHTIPNHICHVFTMAQQMGRWGDEHSWTVAIMIYLDIFTRCQAQAFARRSLAQMSRETNAGKALGLTERNMISICVYTVYMYIYIIYIDPGRECRPKVYHVTNLLGFIEGSFRVCFRFI